MQWQWLQSLLGNWASTLKQFLLVENSIFIVSIRRIRTLFKRNDTHNTKCNGSWYANCSQGNNIDVKIFNYALKYSIYETTAPKIQLNITWSNSFDFTIWLPSKYFIFICSCETDSLYQTTKCCNLFVRETGPLLSVHFKLTWAIILCMVSSFVWTCSANKENTDQLTFD